jgi:hypothetical protein
MEIPVPVLEMPHWRVNFRPSQFNPASGEADRDLFELVEKTAVSFRGWNYPHISSRPNERMAAEKYVSSWADFMGHVEYWRLFYSGQFLHLFSVPEVANKAWRNKYAHINGPGIFSIKNVVFTMTEIFEFATRLAESRMYSGSLSIKIEVKQIRGFILVSDFDRPLDEEYIASEDSISKLIETNTKDIVLNNSKTAIDTAVWFFRQFGWRTPPHALLESDQKALKSGRF